MDYGYFSLRDPHAGSVSNEATIEGFVKDAHRFKLLVTPSRREKFDVPLILVGPLE